MTQGPIATVVLNSGAIGNSYFVDYTNGLDTNNGSAARPLKTLAAALALCTANNGDVVYFIGTARVSETLVWSKAGVSLVGLTAPGNNGRARITPTADATVFTPMVSVTAQGCSFVNFGTFYGFASATAQVCWADTGGRNFYSNCQLRGGGNATAAAQAGMRSLTIGGEGENQFVNCTFGLDTVARATNANATLEFLSGTARIIFRNCVFEMMSSLAGNVHVKALTAALDRYALFDNCTFINAISSTATTITAAFSVAADAGGMCLVQGGSCIGATNLSAAGPVYVQGAVPTGDTSILAVAAS